MSLNASKILAIPEKCCIDGPMAVATTPDLSLCPRFGGGVMERRLDPARAV
jgi:hypothetical protein